MGSLVPAETQLSCAEIPPLHVGLKNLFPAPMLTLMAVPPIFSSDVFVKLTVTTSSGKNRSNKKKKRTGTQKNTISPVFNEAFTFHVSRSGLRTASLHLCVEHELPPPYIPLQQREIQLAKLTLSPGHLCDFVHSASNGLQAKWFHLEPPELR